MSSLPHPDCLHLQAAQGWFELGSFLEANTELENITPGLRAHPEVLKLRCRVYLKLQSWFGVAELSKSLSEFFPDESEWLMSHATALRNLDRLREAYEVLLQAAAKFPNDWQFAYTLSCYAAVLGRFQSSEKWFKQAILLDERKTQKLGIDDPDLKPLWDSMSTTLWKKDR